MQEETGHGTITSEYELLSNLKEKNDVFFGIIATSTAEWICLKGIFLAGWSWKGWMTEKSKDFQQSFNCD